jgi:Head domain of trimeric autotransporter adhesin
MPILGSQNGVASFGDLCDGISRDSQRPVLNLTPQSADVSSVHGTNFGVIIANANPNTSVKYIPQKTPFLGTLNLASNVQSTLDNPYLSLRSSSAIILSAGVINKTFTGQNIISIDTDSYITTDAPTNVSGAAGPMNDYVFIGSSYGVTGSPGLTTGPQNQSVLLGHRINNIGLNTVAIGYYTQTSLNSVAIGSNAIGATGAVSIGFNAGTFPLSAQNSVAIGNSVGGGASGSVYVGYGSTGQNSATGSVALLGNVQGPLSVSIGFNAAGYLNAGNAICIGANTNAFPNAIAIGAGATAYGTSSVVVGYLSSDHQNTNSVVLGTGLIAPASTPFYLNIGGNLIGTTVGATAGAGVYTATQGGKAEQGLSTQTPITGFNITIGPSVSLLMLNPAGTLAIGTIVMPGSPVNGQVINVMTSQVITALTVSGNTGQTILNAPTTLQAGTGFELKYNLGLTTWFRNF